MKKNSPKRVECSLYKSIRKTVFLIMLTLLSTLSALAQERSISGAVIDEKGEPLIGVSVSIKGTTTGTLTDIDGKFKLNAASHAVLSVSYLGYTTKEVSVGNQSVINI